jgi:malonyl-CoA/methylmalonyl-CoA synthetase
MSDNFYGTLRARFAHRLDSPALRVPGGPTWTYRDLDARAARMAGALAALGVEVGDRVLVQVDKSPDAIALYLGCLRSGAVFLPLNTAYTAAEVSFFVDDAEPALVVARPGTLAELDAAGHGPTVRTLGTDSDGTFADEVATADPLGPIVDRDADDLAAMLYTSGTTGRSKGAMLTHANLESNALALHRVWGFGPDDVLLHTLPVFHVHGLFVALHCAMLGGNEIVFLPRFDVDAVLEHLGEATVMMGVPTHYVRLLGDPRFDASACSTIRLFTSGSAPMTEGVHAEFTERTGLRILERYGMTEAGMITSNPYDGARIPGTVGFPLPDVELRVADGDGRPVPTGATGVVEIRSPGLFAGYWRLPEKTAAEHRDGGWFVTGDVGSVDAEGRLTLEGRSSDMIISGGYNIYPKEIELLIDEVDGVGESAVIGVEHRDLGEAVVAIVVPADPAADHAALESRITAALDGELARFKHPKRYHFVDALPRNAMAKVQKSELRTEHAALFAGPG